MNQKEFVINIEARAIRGVILGSSGSCHPVHLTICPDGFPSGNLSTDGILRNPVSPFRGMSYVLSWLRTIRVVVSRIDLPKRALHLRARTKVQTSLQPIHWNLSVSIVFTWPVWYPYIPMISPWYLHELSHTFGAHPPGSSPHPPSACRGSSPGCPPGATLKR